MLHAGKSCNSVSLFIIIHTIKGVPFETERNTFCIFSCLFYEIISRWHHIQKCTPKIENKNSNIRSRYGHLKRDTETPKATVGIGAANCHTWCRQPPRLVPPTATVG
ncbi:MAG TPA: hypothetical protein VIQ97_05415 [Prevotella sp.]